MREVRPGVLWIGNARDSRSFRLIHSAGIRALVQLAYEEPCVEAPRELVVERFPLVDGGGNDRAVTALAVEALAALIDAHVPTLVTCSNGLSRSPCIVAAAVAQLQQRPLQPVLEEIIGRMPADVSPQFWNHVVDVIAAPARSSRTREENR